MAQLANDSTLAGLTSVFDIPVAPSLLDSPPAPQQRPHTVVTETLSVITANNLTSTDEIPSGGNLPPDDKLPLGGILHAASKLPSDANLLPSNILQPEGNAHAGGKLPSDGMLLAVTLEPHIAQPNGNLPPDGILPSDGNQPSISAKSHTRRTPTKAAAAGNLPSGSNLPTGNNPSPPVFAKRTPGRVLLPGGTLLPGGKLLSAGNRIVEIRAARTVQDGHSRAENNLFLEMWRLGARESENSRTLRIGLAEMSRLIGADKTSCRDYVRSLTRKLAIEASQAYVAAAGASGATVYRIFSFNQVLERRRRAGMTHVVRIGGVVFIDPATGREVLPGGNLPPDGSLPTDGNMPAVSGGNIPMETAGKLPTHPGGNLPASSLLRKEDLKNTTSTALRELLQAQLSNFDDAAVVQLWASCQKNVPDVAIEEVGALFHTKHRIAFAPGVKNPIGLLITAVANACTPAAIAEMRRSREVVIEPEIVRTHEEQIADLEFYIREFPSDHEQIAGWRSKLEELRKEIKRR